MMNPPAESDGCHPCCSPHDDDRWSWQRPRIFIELALAHKSTTTVQRFAD